jgi:hypothetical protein
MTRHGRNAAEGAAVGRDQVAEGGRDQVAEGGRDPVEAEADARRWEEEE